MDALAAPNEEISYVYTISNTGTVTLSNTTVRDAALSGVVCSKSTLAPGDSFICGDHSYLVRTDIGRLQCCNGTSLGE